MPSCGLLIYHVRGHKLLRVFENSLDVDGFRRDTERLVPRQSSKDISAIAICQPLWGIRYHHKTISPRLRFNSRWCSWGSAPMAPKATEVDPHIPFHDHKNTKVEDEEVPRVVAIR